LVRFATKFLIALVLPAFVPAEPFPPLATVSYTASSAAEHTGPKQQRVIALYEGVVDGKSADRFLDLISKSEDQVIGRRIRPLGTVLEGPPMRMKLLAAVASVLAAPFATSAAPAAVQGLNTGNDVLAVCSSEDIDDGYRCMGFLEGVTRTAGLYGALGSKPRLCLPDAVTLQQARDVAVKYLQDHPDERHHLSAGITLIALVRAFPCAGSER
jgi:hypothetical protein